MPEEDKADSRFREIGATGLKSSYGVILEEFLPQLSGRRAVETYREMGDNDPIAFAVLYGIEMYIRQVTWTVTGPHAAFVEDAMHGMSHSWEDFIAEAISKVQYGFAYHEIVYKQTDDGMVTWRKLPIRGQDTLGRWELDGNGGIQGMWQNVGTQEVFIPIDKALHFRTSQKKNNPEGRSFLRGAYRPWWYKKRIEEIEAVGIERDLAGIPVAKVPAEWLSSEADATAQAAGEAAREIVTQLRNDEQAGIVWPSLYDEAGNALTDIYLMKSAGTRNFVTGDVIARKGVEMAACVLFDMILMGHESVGSYALSSSKAELATMGLQSQLKEIATVVNQWGVPRLLALNGLDNSTPTEVVPGELAPIDVKTLIESVWKLSMSGAPIFPDTRLTEELMRRLGLPAPSGEGVPLPAQNQGALPSEGVGGVESIPVQVSTNGGNGDSFPV